jgi:tRNA (uracil-5-)-methyltransferase
MSDTKVDEQASKRARTDAKPAAKERPKKAPVVMSNDLSLLDISVRPDSYQAELQSKIDKVRHSFERAQLQLPSEIERFCSAPSHFRHRAGFSVWHYTDEASGEEKLHYFMMGKQHGDEHHSDESVETQTKAPTRQPVRVDSFPIGSCLINELMPRVLEYVHAPQRRAIMSERLFEVRFLTSLSGEALVTLIYHRPLLATDEGALWKSEALGMCTALNLVGVVGRSRNVKLVIGRGDYVMERLNVPNRGELIYKQSEELFGQSNGGIAQQMLGWAVDVATSGISSDAETKVNSDDLLELYCGSGAFTVALAPRFRRVFATELSKHAIDVAHENMASNHVDNVALGRVSAEDLRQAMEGVRPYQRLAHVDFKSYTLNTVFVDPPRAGCGPEVSPFLSQFAKIIYISCNPNTMVEDIKRLESTHYVARFAIFDQFAYSAHVEAGALLLRRQ